MNFFFFFALVRGIRAHNLSGTFTRINQFPYRSSINKLLAVNYMKFRKDLIYELKTKCLNSINLETLTPYSCCLKNVCVVHNSNFNCIFVQNAKWQIWIQLFLAHIIGFNLSRCWGTRFNISYANEDDVICRGFHTILGGFNQWQSDTYIMYMHAHIGGEGTLHDWLVEFVHSAMRRMAAPVR
jgi:hypothetical protein